MAASAEYIKKLEDHATSLRETNSRIVHHWIKVVGDDPHVDSEVSRMLELNRTEAEKYSQQAMWHRNDNGEPVVCWPRQKQWSD